LLPHGDGNADLIHHEVVGAFEVLPSDLATAGQISFVDGRYQILTIDTGRENVI